MKNKNSPAPEPQRKSDVSFDDEYPAPPWVYKNYVENMSRKESLDIIYKIAARAKQQIARGECFTPEQVEAYFELRTLGKSKK